VIPGEGVKRSRASEMLGSRATCDPKKFDEHEQELPENASESEPLSDKQLGDKGTRTLRES